MRVVSKRPSKKQWGLRLVVAFGIGVLAAFVQNRMQSVPAHSSVDVDPSSGAVSPAPSITTRGAGEAAAAPVQAPERSVASSARVEALELPHMLAPVRWSSDLAQGFKDARARGQLVLLYLAPSADT